MTLIVVGIRILSPIVVCVSTESLSPAGPVFCIAAGGYRVLCLLDLVMVPVLLLIYTVILKGTGFPAMPLAFFILAARTINAANAYSGDNIFIPPPNGNLPATAVYVIPEMILGTLKAKVFRTSPYRVTLILLNKGMVIL